MAIASSPPDAALRPAPISSIQPGGGLGMRIELAWGRWRRFWLRTFRPGYVRRMLALRQGECPGCRHDIIDPRDLKYWSNVCGYRFREEDDRFLWRSRLGLARAGWAEIVLVSLAAGIGLAGVGAAHAFGLPLWAAAPTAAVLLLFWFQLVWFFRDPERPIPDQPSVMVSPADGTVTDIGEVDEPDFPGGRAFRVGIFLSVFDVHVNRAACAGRVTRLLYFPGQFVNALRPVSAAVNEQLWIDMVESGGGRPLRIKQVAGAIARRIVCHLKPGDELARGERIGMIKYGSRTELLLPAGERYDVAVQIGQKVHGGSTILLRTREVETEEEGASD